MNVKRLTKNSTSIFPGMRNVRPLPSLSTRLISGLPVVTFQTTPLIGILAADGNKRFLGNQENFADLIRMGWTQGEQIVVLTPKGIRDNYWCSGFTLDKHSKQNRWLRALFPLPPVIYNRIPNRKIEKKPFVQMIIQKLLKADHVHIFNPSFFDKWTFFQHMQESEKLKSLLPETTRLDSPETLSHFLKQHQDLYLKPIEGKAGIGMMRLRIIPQGFELIHQTPKEKKKRILRRFSTCYQLIHRLTQQKPYLIQQTIPLATYQEQPFDIRMLLQKDEKGTWQITGTGIRVAGKEAISTHVPMGGRIVQFNEAISAAFGDHSKAIGEKLEQTGLEIAKWLEQKQGYLLGEMSLDLGIESNQRIWVFEANAKPQKFDEPDIRKRSLIRLIQYARYVNENLLKKRASHHENLYSYTSGD
jgi:hypothetical protein